jgi:hypothetical protein
VDYPWHSTWWPCQGHACHAADGPWC